MSNSPELCLPHAGAWRTWLRAHESDPDASDGVWLVLAKKGVTSPTSLTYAEALDEALCSGWIDGQKLSRDATTFLQRFTPRRRRSIWSARNVEHIGRLTAEGRMRPRGEAEVEAAQADGRWERAYPGSADAAVPEDLEAALAAHPAARQAFEGLSRSARFSIIFQLSSARRPDTRVRRLAAAIETLVGN